jgi:hypothetical protein
MNATDFELNISLPADARFAKAMRDLAAHAARYAGGREQDVERYGAAVERVVIACLDRAPAGAPVLVILRRGAGPVEFLIGCESRTDAAAHDAGIAVGWTREQGTPMCRVALDL